MTLKPLGASQRARALFATRKACGAAPDAPLSSLPEAALAAAAAALSLASTSPIGKAERAFGLSPGAVRRARDRQSDTFLFALTQALLELGGARLANAPISTIAPVIDVTSVPPVRTAQRLTGGGGAKALRWSRRQPNRQLRFAA